MTKEELKKEAEEYGKKATAWLEDREPLDQRDIENAYLAGAEPREKRIEELIALINAERERQEKCDDVHLRKIADLEKENAELRKDKKELCHSISEGGKACVYLNEQLTKAKELLKKYVIWCGTATPIKSPLQIEVEQFLKETEK